VGASPQFSLDNMWITISSGILGFSFIFGNSIRTVFESCLTLFVIHPFDVGDTIFIEGSFHVVEEASLNKVRAVCKAADVNSSSTSRRAHTCRLRVTAAD
jgi:small-conductance mechanosensitive channel